MKFVSIVWKLPKNLNFKLVFKKVYDYFEFKNEVNKIRSSFIFRKCNIFVAWFWKPISQRGIAGSFLHFVMILLIRGNTDFVWSQGLSERYLPVLLTFINLVCSFRWFPCNSRFIITLLMGGNVIGTSCYYSFFFWL